MYNLQVVVLENQSLWAKDKPLSIAYRLLCSNNWLLWYKASCCVQFTSLLCLNIMSLWAKDKPLSIAYGRYAQIIGCYGSKQVVVYNLQVVVLEKQSL